jgi:hypothetical protein
LNCIYRPGLSATGKNPLVARHWKECKTQKSALFCGKNRKENYLLFAKINFRKKSFVRRFSKNK